MRVDAPVVLDAVAELGIDQVDPEALQQQHDVLIDGGDAGGDGDVEGDGAAVGLGHVGGDGVAAELLVGLVEAEIEAIGVMMQGPGGTEAGDAAADDRHTPRHERHD